MRSDAVIIGRQHQEAGGVSSATCFSGEKSTAGHSKEKEYIVSMNEDAATDSHAVTLIAKLKKE